VTKKYDINTKYGYITVMKDLSKEEPKLEVVPMNTTVLAAAFDKYKEMIDYKKDVDYQYVAYLRKHPKDPKDEKDKGELVKMNLTKNWNQAT